jgi:hypothetical protein
MFSGPDCIQSHLLYVAFWYGNTQNDVSFRETSENGGILVCLMSFLTLSGTSYCFADHFKMFTNRCVCIGIELTIGFEFLYNMERSRVVESPHFSILQPNLAKKRNVSLFHAQINVCHF